MSYLSEDLIQEVTELRKRSHSSQRLLASRSGLTQAHISQIENGRLEPGLSSFIQMARALDLELVLVPKKLLPAVQGILRQSDTSGVFSDERQLSLLSKAEKLVAKQKKISGGSITLDRMAEHIRFLKGFRLSESALSVVSDIAKILSEQKGDLPSEALDHAARTLQNLRNSLAHPVEAPRPAYAFGNEDDDA